MSMATAAVPSEVAVVDRYLTKRKRAWTLVKLLHTFKENHAGRFSQI